MNRALFAAVNHLGNSHPVILDAGGLIHATPRTHDIDGRYMLTTVAAGIVYGRTTCPYCWTPKP